MNDASDRVRGLVEQCVDAIEDGRRDAIAALLAAHPDLEPAVRDQLDVLERSGLLEAPREPAGVPERLGEFRLLRQLGRGGMGVVWLAEQERLQRQVALKLMHPEYLYFPNARERFEREVQASARLRHPGIVPVHTVGEADGVPYFAMEHVVGASLGEVLAQLAGTPCERLDAPALRRALAAALTAKGETAAVADAPLFVGTWVRAVCRIVADVAVALQHAHDHGVLHRDLKPSNILLGADGRVSLIDFGLALASDDARITRSGAMLGSLPYMAPEQVRGDAAAIDARTDVYALGVVLYELLTLTLPHGDGSGTTHARILDGSAEAPVRRNALVHPDAEAICLQAMDPVSARRYPSAQALAEDLLRFVALRPVIARRQTTWMRAHRYVVRHPARALAVAFGVLAVVVAPSVVAWQQHAANRAVHDALTVAETQQRLAEHHLERALAAVDTMLSRTANSRLKNVPRTAKLRERLLEDALAFHLELAESQPGAADVLAEAARSRRHVGELRIELGQVAAGVVDLEAALAAFAGLPTAQRPSWVRCEVARTRVALARAQWSAGQIEPYCDQLRQALDGFAAELAATPDDRALQIERSRARVLLALGLARMRDLDGANAEFAAVERELGASPPDDLDAATRSDWLLTRGRWADAQGVAAIAGGDTVTAGAWFERAATALEAASAASPDGPQAVLYELAGVRTRAAFRLHQRRDWERALPALDAAIALWTRLIADEPDDATAPGQLAMLLSSRGDAHTQLRDLTAARADFDAAVAQMDAAVARFPEEVANLKAGAIVHGEFATWCRVQGDREAARAQYAACVAGFRAYAAAVPDDEQAKANVVASLANSSNALAEWGDHVAARELIDAALVMARARRGGDAARALIEVLGMAADRARIGGDVQRTQELLDEARTRAAAWLAESPDDASRMGTVVFVAVESAGIAVDLGRLDQARDVLAAAEDVAVRSAATGIAGNRRWLAILLLRRAAIERDLGQRESARRYFSRALDEAQATREFVSDVSSLAALFDDPDFADLGSRR